MEITQHEKEGRTILILEGVLDLENLGALKERLMDCLKGQTGVTIDLQHIDEWDAAGIQVLWSAQKTALEKNQPFSIIHASNSIVKAAEAIGVCNLL